MELPENLHRLTRFEMNSDNEKLLDILIRMYDARIKAAALKDVKGKKREHKKFSDLDNTFAREAAKFEKIVPDDFNFATHHAAAYIADIRLNGGKVKGSKFARIHALNRARLFYYKWILRTQLDKIPGLNDPEDFRSRPWIVKTYLEQEIKSEQIASDIYREIIKGRDFGENKPVELLAESDALNAILVNEFIDKFREFMESGRAKIHADSLKVFRAKAREIGRKIAEAESKAKKSKFAKHLFFGTKLSAEHYYRDAVIFTDPMIKYSAYKPVRGITKHMLSFDEANLVVDYIGEAEYIRDRMKYVIREALPGNSVKDHYLAHDGNHLFEFLALCSNTEKNLFQILDRAINTARRNLK